MRDAHEFAAGPDDEGRRLDRVLRRLIPDMALSAIYAALRRGDIRLNGRRARPEARLAAGDIIAMVPRLAPSSPAPPGSAPGADALEYGRFLLLGSPDLIFLAKPRGLESHGPAGLDSLLAPGLRAARPASLSFSPGPLHRLDRNTSGIITFPASAEGARRFSAALREDRIRKFYLALLSGRLPGPAVWKDSLIRDEAGRRTLPAQAGAAGARGARARASLLGGGELGGREVSLALIELETGITHQIRVQAALRGHALVGDLKYGGPALVPACCPAWTGAGGAPAGGGYLLHAWSLVFEDGLFPELPPLVQCPLPADAEALLALALGHHGLAAALARGNAALAAPKTGEGRRIS